MFPLSSVEIMELRSRSRSQTPFQTQNFLEAESFEGNNHVTVTRSSRRTTTSLRTTNSGGTTNLTEQFYESPTKPALKSKRTKSRNAASTFKTSDYSSEEGEVESMAHISENEKNQIIEDAKAAANGKTEISALNLYRRAGRYWDKYPKTDYTYSRHSRDRVELAPGVVQMPNMSRRTIHSYDSSTNTDSYFDRIASRSQYIKQRLFSSHHNNNTEEIADDSYKISRVSSSSRRRTITSTITSVFTSIYTVIFWCLYSVHQVVNSSTIWFMKKLHHLASRLMLLDNWLLRKSGRGKKTNAVMALCLLPLLLFGAWWLLWSLASLAYGAVLSPSNGPPVVPLPVTQNVISAGANHVVPSKPEEISNNLAYLDADAIIEKIMQSPKFHNIITNYYQSAKTEQQSDTEREERLLTIIGQLQEEINNVKQELIFLEETKNADLNKILARFHSETVRNIAVLTHKLNRCCNKPMINLEPYVAGALKSLLNDPDFLTNQKGLTDWLHALFVAKQDLEMRLSTLTQNLTQDYDKSVENSAKVVMEKVVARLANSGTITEEHIIKVVKSALMVYDADKTGLVDYAMEPMGGQIVTTRCTESYHTGTAVISVLGIPLWYPSNSPRIVIVPGINPGECWAFQNFPGFMVIKLANRIRIEAFSMEHVSRLLVPEGKIDSAPKEFEVYGLDNENDKDPVKIGEYVYDYDGDPIQYFAAHRHGLVFSMVEVRIKSNHGNPNYTCLYRFRVHGVSSEPT